MKRDRAASIDSARKAAIAAVRDIMAEEMRSGELNPASFIEVEDWARSHLFTLQFSEAYRVKVW